MPSEVIQKENEINVEAKEIIDKLDTKTETKENGSQQSKTADEVQINDELAESKVTEQLSESENKENEEPAVEDTETLKKRAEELLIDGKRHLIIKDFQAAVDVLSEACSVFGLIYGEMAEECAEAYFNYGCALLELSKDQITPVRHDKDDKENEDNDSINEESVGKEEILTKEETCANKTFDKDEKQSTDKEESLPDENISVDKNDQSSNEEEKLPEDSIPADEEDKLDEDVEDDVNDLQLAWEMLDLAKVIYKSKETEESKLKLAEVLMKCGEVSIEDEKFETAVEDMTESLEIRRLLLPEDNRIIAETLFQLGIAQELGGSGERAIELLTEAAAVLDQRMKTLENSTSDNAAEEVSEIKSIIPEIQDRIVDIKERKKAAISALLAAVGAARETTTSSGASSSTKQASNIGHLVRKRPKQEETDGTPNKVPKLEEPSAAKQ